jgi:hypothetical protein
MSVESYSEGMNYETFIKRAFKTYDNSKPGMHLSVLQNLIWAENGDSCVSHLPSFDKQLLQTKKYLHKGFAKFLKRRLKADLRTEIENLEERIDKARSSTDIIDIVNVGLKLTQEFKNY